MSVLSVWHTLGCTMLYRLMLATLTLSTWTDRPVELTVEADDARGLR